MLSHRIITSILAATCLFSTSLPVLAAENFGSRHHSHHGHQQRQISVGTNGLPSFIPRVGTYSGAISAIRDRGNGNYFAINNSVNGHARRTGNMTGSHRLAPKARIINVNTRTIGSECSYEAGVCVIRP